MYKDFGKISRNMPSGTPKPHRYSSSSLDAEYVGAVVLGFLLLFGIGLILELFL